MIFILSTWKGQRYETIDILCWFLNMYEDISACEVFYDKKISLVENWIKRSTVKYISLTHECTVVYH